MFGFRRSKPAPLPKAKIAAAGAFVGSLFMFLFDPSRGKGRRAKAWDMASGRARRARRKAEQAGRAAGAEMHGLREKMKHLKEEPKTFDDATLKAKVETELFGDPSVPKGRININVEDGIVFLRGEVESDRLIKQLGAKTSRINGVEEVSNLLTVEGSGQTVNIPDNQTTER